MVSLDGVSELGCWVTGLLTQAPRGGAPYYTNFRSGTCNLRSVRTLITPLIVLTGLLISRGPFLVQAGPPYKGLKVSKQYRGLFSGDLSMKGL